jgi:hypothetical protein
VSIFVVVGPVKSSNRELKVVSLGLKPKKASK